MTDREKSITNSIDKLLNMYNLKNQHFVCINHIYQNVKRHITKRFRKMKVKLLKLSKEEQVKLNKLIDETKLSEDLELELIEDEGDDELYEDEPLSLVDKQKEEIQFLSNFKTDFYNFKNQLKNRSKFESELKEMQKKWNKVEIQYFNKFIKTDLFKNIDNQLKYMIDDLTNNISEAFNAFLKRFLENKLASIDSMILAIYSFCNELVDNFNRGYNGNYYLLINLLIIINFIFFLIN